MEPRAHTDEFLLVHADPWFHSLCDSVREMRTLPVDKSSLLPLALPLLVASSIEIPLAELIGKVFKTLL
ncbi:hypothetical protein OKA05_13720 [Luteolibacter arcticus]|uniref:Uncharacterized protein n=1 Tax=Luteolibacter arcticus TaxID=1581411 RepID=A0ABT3GJB7_9BACT|nr:hypothetical protein [Luteolibacter arcticus]MCW1923618.1 hypothetical protein [Luteolibacter arcticus]